MTLEELLGSEVMLGLYGFSVEYKGTKQHIPVSMVLSSKSY